MAVASKDREVDEEEVVRAFDEEREAQAKPIEAKGVKAPEETVTKTVEEKAQATGATTAIDVDAIVARASEIFHFDGGLRDLLKTYLSYAQKSSEFSSWLGRLPMEDDIKVLGVVLSMQFALKETVGQKPTTIYANYVASKIHVVFNEVFHTLQCYDPNLGVYVPTGPGPQCEYRIKALIEDVDKALGNIVYVKLRKREGRTVLVVGFENAKNFESVSFLREVYTKLEDYGLSRFKTLTRRPHMVAFPNGFYLDLDELVNGTVNPIDYNPDYYVTIRLGAPVDLTVLRELVPSVPITRPGADGREEYRQNYISFMSDAFRRYAPTMHKYFLDWVNTDEYATLLLEIIGYTMYPDYPIRAIFVLLGGGNDPMRSGGNGKSTYLALVGRIDGESNVVHIDFQKIVKSEFAASELVGKLANIVPDMSASAIEDTAILKALSGGDYISANVKYKPFVKFKNTAKLIASMNELPYFNDKTKAMQDRLHIIPFPNTFDEDPGLRDRLLNHEEIPRLVALSLVALRAVLNRGWFITKGLNEVYNVTIDPVGEFIKQLLTTGFNGCRAEIIKGAKTPREELYALFMRWKEEKNATRPVPKQTFTTQLGRWGIGVTKDSKNRYFYTNIQLTCENTETIEQYNEEASEGEEFNEE